jgi:hypothetical protein
MIIEPPSIPKMTRASTLPPRIVERTSRNPQFSDWPTQRHTQGPAKLDRSHVFANDFPVEICEFQQPASRRPIIRGRVVEAGGQPLHARYVHESKYRIRGALSKVISAAIWRRRTLSTA